MSDSTQWVLAELQRLVTEVTQRLDAVEADPAADALQVRLARAHAYGLADQIHELVTPPRDSMVPDPDV